MRPGRIAAPLVTILVIFALLPAPAHAGTGCELLPPQWLGQWRWRLIVRDCETKEVLHDLSGMDRVCWDDCFDIVWDGSQCRTSLDGNTLDIDCAVVQEFVDSCRANVEYWRAYTLAGTTISGVGGATETMIGCVPELLDTCTEIEYSATRVEGPVACGVPLATVNWGVVKGVFR